MKKLLFLLLFIPFALSGQKGLTYGGKVLTSYDRNQPLNISETCEFWYDGWDASTFTLDGTSVYQWDDKSGNDRHVLNGNDDATRPTYDASTGRVTFTASNSTFLQSAGFASALSQPITIFIVAKLTGALDEVMILLTGENPDRLIIGPASSLNRIFGGSNINGSATDANDNIHVACFNGVSSNYWINGILEGSGDVGANDYSRVTLGANGGLLDFFADAEIMEVIGYNATLTTTDRDKITGYLSDRWGITATTGHEGYILTDD